jgi:hypothetical protein
MSDFNIQSFFDNLFELEENIQKQIADMFDNDMGADLMNKTSMGFLFFFIDKYIDEEYAPKTEESKIKFIKICYIRFFKPFENQSYLGNNNMGEFLFNLSYKTFNNEKFNPQFNRGYNIALCYPNSATKRFKELPLWKSFVKINKNKPNWI